MSKLASGVRLLSFTMNFFERIPTSWLLTGAALACLLLWAAPGWARAVDSTPAATQASTPAPPAPAVPEPQRRP